MVTKQQPVAKKYLMARERFFEHIPNLIDIQLKSFEWFLQAGKEPSKRENRVSKKYSEKFSRFKTTLATSALNIMIIVSGFRCVKIARSLS